jgi:hypothetical protein
MVCARKIPGWGLSPVSHPFSSRDKAAEGVTAATPTARDSGKRCTFLFRLAYLTIGGEGGRDLVV